MKLSYLFLFIFSALSFLTQMSFARDGGTCPGPDGGTIVYTADDVQACWARQWSYCEQVGNGAASYTECERMRVECQSMKTSCPGGSSYVDANSPATPPLPPAPPEGKTPQESEAQVAPAGGGGGDRGRKDSTAPSNADNSKNGQGTGANESEEGAAEGEISAAEGDVPDEGACRDKDGNPGISKSGFCERKSDLSVFENENVEASNKSQVCEKAQTRAEKCCRSPMACMTGMGQDTVSAIAGLATAGAGMALGAQGIQQACSTMQAMGYTAAGINSGAAMFCQSKRSECSDACSSSRKRWEEAIVACGGNKDLDMDYDVAYQKCGKARIQLYRREIIRARSLDDLCDNYLAEEGQMLQQAVQSGTAAAMADLCKQASASAAGEGNAMGTKPVNTSDCANPAYASSPQCSCNGPNAAFNPVCPGYQGNQKAGGVNSGYAAREGGSGNSKGGIDTGDDLGDGMNQAPNLAGGSAAAASSNGVPSNGGGFSGGSQGGGGQGGPGAAGGGGGGYNTDVLNGLSAGGGYSGNPGGGPSGGGGGGWSAYGKGKSASTFDLKQFLPGGKKDPTRKLAGLNGSMRPDLGPPSSDIFQRITNRVGFLCIGERLMDCPPRGGKRTPAHMRKAPHRDRAPGA